ncbi:MAG: DUF3810 domain-containing protein [Oscillospiraceae bacterium]|nr:DUF3810 domain-containing protein [Oscillospiraceae bacterium]
MSVLKKLRLKNLRNQNSLSKSLRYFLFTSGIAGLFTGISRLSVGFSEWYAINIYPLFVKTVGRFFCFFSFSFAEIIILLLIAGVLVWLGITITKLIKIRRESRCNRLRLFGRMSLIPLCVASTLFLNFVLFCGINYNRRTFYDKQEIESYFTRTTLDEWKVYLALLQSFYETYPQISSYIHRDENGVFVLSDLQENQLTTSTTAAMARLAQDFPRLDVHFPRPKPIRFLAEFMSDAFLVGFYFPLTMEANFNNIAPDSDRIISALHELVHVAGFMREDEANFISFIAGRNSGEPKLIYSAYLYAFSQLRNYGLQPLTPEMYAQLPEYFQQLFDAFSDGDNWIYYEDSENMIFYAELLHPKQIQVDLAARSDFWWGRMNTVTHVYDDGEIIDIVITENTIAQAIAEVSVATNDAFLQAQGLEDGVLSYGRMVDLLFATELMNISD